ncbi:MAG TPA: hypothetical protein GXZ82_01905 [Firmicutes bacterium]|nr:hypothetical protein [Bacillota bacterium]
MAIDPYVLGVDAGGTSTRCWAVTTAGLLLGTGVAGPGNFYTVGAEGLADRICEVVAAALGEVSGPAEALCLGAAGVGRLQEAEEVYAALQRRGLAKRLIIENDGYISLYAGTLGKPGVVVIAGTGSIAVGIDAGGQRRRAGGWGWLLGDEGSGYDISRQTLTAILKAADGRMPQLSCAPAVLAQLGVSGPDYLPSALLTLPDRKERIAGLAPLILDAAAEDAIVREIVQKAAAELVQLGLHVHRRLKLPTSAPIVMAGGLFKHQVMRTAFGRELAQKAPALEARALPWEAALGAVFMALNAAGTSYTKEDAAAIAAQVDRKKNQ